MADSISNYMLHVSVTYSGRFYTDAAQDCCKFSLYLSFCVWENVNKKNILTFLDRAVIDLLAPKS